MFFGKIVFNQFRRLAANLVSLATTLVVVSLPFTVFGVEPDEISGLSLWLEAGDCQRDVDNDVSLWKDRRGELSFRQEAVSRRPTVMRNEAGEYPALRFDGSQYLKGGPFAGFDSREFTVFLVFRPVSGRRAQVLLSNAYESGARRRSSDMWGVKIARRKIRFYARKANGGVKFTAHPAPTDWSVYCAQWRADGGMSAWLEGEERAAAGADAVPQNHLHTRIGAKYRAKRPRQRFQGDIAEIIVYERALGENERIDVENYLRTKYSLGVSVRPDIGLTAVGDPNVVVLSGPIALDPVSAAETENYRLSHDLRVERAELNPSGEVVLTLNAPLRPGTLYQMRIAKLIARDGEELAPDAPLLFDYAAIPADRLDFWSRADRGVKTNSLNQIQSWRELRGHRVLTAPSFPRRPKLIERALNGLPAVSFDGQNDLLGDALANAVAPPRALSIFMVAKNDAPKKRQRIVEERFFNAKGSKNCSWLVLGRGGNFRAKIDKRRHPLDSPSVSWNGEWSVSRFVAASDAETASQFAAIEDAVESRFSIGGANGKNAFSGEIAELLVYHRELSLGEMEQVGDYLFDKYFKTNALDTDGDQLPDAWELARFGNLDQGPDGDPDGDGLDNLTEYFENCDPTNPDSDGDGLNDKVEIEAYHSNPLNPDSDGDQLPDAWEVEHQLDPKQNDADSDLDSDGLSNLQEFRLGLDPANNDSDGDQLPDAWEVKYEFDPKRNDAGQDPDEDGLSNLQEYRAGTNPRIPEVDLDGDGLPDAWEIRCFGGLGHGPDEDHDGDGLSNLRELGLGTCPTNVDCDGDGLWDGREIDELGCDPLKRDSDGDQIDDRWEAEHGFDPGNPADAAEDPDEDGLSNLQEYLLGTDPLDPDSDDDGWSDGDEFNDDSDPNDGDSDPERFLTLSPTRLTIPEGGSNACFLSLSTKPRQGIQVAIVPDGSNPRVRLATESPLVFSPTNWNKPQKLRFEAEKDAASPSGQTIFRLDAGAYGEIKLAVEILDDEFILKVVAGHGGDVSPKGEIVINPGDSVTLEATAVPDAYFVGWSGVENGELVADNPLTFQALKATCVEAVFAMKHKVHRCRLTINGVRSRWIDFVPGSNGDFAIQALDPGVTALFDDFRLKTAETDILLDDFEMDAIDSPPNKWNVPDDPYAFIVAANPDADSDSLQVLKVNPIKSESIRLPDSAATRDAELNFAIQPAGPPANPAPLLEWLGVELDFNPDETSASFNAALDGQSLAVGLFPDVWNQLTWTYDQFIDVDHDQLDDEWEWENFHGLDQDGDGDYDGDGVSNLEEFRSESDPLQKDPKVSFAVSESNVMENSGNINVKVSLSHPVACQISVIVKIAAATANPETDFIFQSPALIKFKSYQTDAEIIVQIIDDDQAEGNENLVLKLVNPYKIILGSKNEHAILINDDDGEEDDKDDDNPDKDGDGLPDAWELEYFDNLDQGPDDDPDGDGVSNLEEYRVGRHPFAGAKNDSDNQLKIKIYSPMEFKQTP